MAEGEFKCGGIKVSGKRVEINRKIVSRVTDELAPADVIGIENCMRCGVCSYTCPFWLSSKSSTDVPAWRTYEINKIYSMYYTAYGMVARFLRLRRLSNKEFMAWTESAYNCTACGACTMTSPMEVPNWYTAILMRRVLHLSGFNLPSAEKMVSNTKDTGNALGITKDQWTATANSTGLPVDKKGADTLYIPTPLEIKTGKTLTSVASVMSKLGVNYTVSSVISDPGYYAYMLGGFETARKVYENIAEAVKTLGVKKIVTTDGTAYFWLRWQGPKSTRMELPSEIQHITQVVYEKYKGGNVKLKKADVDTPVAVHYSEFLSRLGGVEEPPRELLRLTVPQFKEPKVPPSSDKLYTCGHMLELLDEKKDTVKKAREYVMTQLNKWGGKTVVVFDPNCKLSLESGVKDNQGSFKVIDITTILDGAIVK
ncbi:(Fe-S)-binding protein [Stygiolobus caldivivus]|uniref:4Fe-4S ferredoxin-type domain-containing protein n=1 Tax=Stygiolobus caldivivus TaxID=2824673 RepID=A0A8D5ZHY6_9CREN|nr:(Fe-S)-binding protein [Stygiolobus caldivivus]BCU68822.1 hypothetical protein KN1_01190 [Stygiolobus caldivivus]